MEQNNPENNIKTKHNIDPYTIRILIVMFISFCVMMGASVSLRVQINNASTDTAYYRHHYVFIVGDEMTHMIDSIAGEANKYGVRAGAFVEVLNAEDSSDEAYADKIRMASSMDVDGIIIAGGDGEEIAAAVNAAAAVQIPTIAVLSDCPDSLRKTIIAPDEYDLGRTYARGVILVADIRTLNIAVLIKEEQDALFMEGLEDTLRYEGNHLSVNLITEDVTDMPNFRLMDRVQELLSDSELDIDMVLCPDEYNTQIVYQAVKDYNLSGKAKIIGYGISEPLLNAIDSGDISALIYIDAVQTGMMCVDTLNDYIENGIIRDNITVENITITKENLERYLNE